MSAYLEQYDRMKRWYDKFGSLNQGRAHDLASDNYLDDIHAFFQNCYHLKDWIKHDSTVPSAVQNAVELHINSSRALGLCADICNSQKHLILQSPRSGQSPTFGEKQFNLALGGAGARISLKWEVNTTSGSIDAFQLATNCIADWDSFLATNGLQ
jgi:hypothetical protein